MAAFVLEWDVIGYSVALLSIYYLSLTFCDVLFLMYIINK